MPTPLLKAPPVVGQIVCTMPGAYSFIGTNQTISSVQGNQSLRVAALYISKITIFDRIGCEVTTGGESGSTIRLGIYADNGFQYPGSLVLDAGTVTGDTIAIKEINISQLLQPGLYWMGGCIQGAPTTQPAVRITDETINVDAPGTTTATITTDIRCYIQVSVAGALPATFSTSVLTGGRSLRMFIRAS